MITKDQADREGFEVLFECSRDSYTYRVTTFEYGDVICFEVSYGDNVNSIEMNRFVATHIGRVLARWGKMGEGTND